MNQSRDITNPGSRGASKPERSTQHMLVSAHPKRWGGSSPGKPTVVHRDAARLVVNALKDQPKELQAASKSLRGVAPAFYSEVPFKRNPTLKQVDDFVEKFSRDQVGQHPLTQM